MVTSRDFSSFADDLAKMRAERESSAPTTVAPIQPPSSSYKEYKRRRGLDFSAPTTPISRRVDEQEDGPSLLSRGIGAIGSLPAVKTLGLLLDVVDTPRATVASGVREGLDFVLPKALGVDQVVRDGEVVFTGKPSAKDFYEQARDNMVSQEILKDLGMKKGLGRSALGFGLDVVGDPTSYVSFGVAPVARAGGRAIQTGGRMAAKEFGARSVQQVADEGLAFAVRQRSSTGLVKALVNSIETAGYRLDDTGKYADDAVNNLLTETATRGLGAFTPEGLARAGVDEALAVKLGIPKMRKTVGLAGAAFEIPGSQQYANLMENLKGAVKSQARTGKLSNKSRQFRTAFITDKAGKRAMIQRLMDVNAPIEERVTAAVASTTVNGAVSAGRVWAFDAGNRLQRALKRAPGVDPNASRLVGENRKGSWFSLSPDEGRAATDALEDADLPQGPLQVQGRQELDRLFDEITDFDVELPYRQLYVPHMTTDKADRFAKKNTELAKFYTTNVYTPEGFQRMRSLNPGDTFLGVKLEKATIREINDVFRKHFKVDFDLFESDLRVILPKYINSASQAVTRATQIRLLTDVGIGKAVATRMVRKPLDPANPVYRQAQTVMKLAQRNIDKINDARVVVLSNGAVVRHSNIEAARNEMMEQQTAAVGELARLRDKVGDLSRINAPLKRQLDAAQKSVDDAQQAVDVLKRSLPRERGKMGRELTSKLLTAETRLKQMQNNLAKKQKRWAKLDPAKAATDEARYRAEIAAVEDRISRYNDDLSKLSTAKVQPGFGPTPLDARIRTAEARIADLSADRDLAMNAADFALADNRLAIAWLEQFIARMDAGVDLTKNRPGIAKSKMGASKVSEELAQKYRDQMNAVLGVLRSMDQSPAVKRIMKLEAAAAASDMKMLNSRNQLDAFERMLKAAENQQYVQQLEPIIMEGMKQVSESTQLPKWVLEMTEVQNALRRVPLFGTWVRKYFFDLFRSYAIARPGFHPRNLYSGLFGMFMEAGVGSGDSLQKWMRYMNMFTKYPDREKRLAAAVAKGIDPDEVRLMEEAWEAVNGTGAGLIGQEGFGNPARSGKLDAVNPFSTTNILFRASRGAGGRVENLVRGAHAYDAMRRGASIDQAMDVVNKWQFNYTDITQFDEYMKLVNPFWVFFSRNVALQTQTWVQSAARFNRSYMNFKRNMEFGREEEKTPEWYDEEMAIRVGEGEEGGIYLFSDLPAATWPSELEMLTSPFDKEKFGKLVSTTGPWIKAPIEYTTGRSLYTGSRIDDTKYEKIDFGLRQILNTLDWDIPGSAIERNAEGELMIRADVAHALRSSLPGSGQLSRLFPGTEEAKDKSKYARISWLTGIGLRENDERTKRGLSYSEYLDEVEEQRRRSSLGF